MARSNYSNVELSISGLLSQQEAEAWVADNLPTVQHYTDNESPWSINETVKMHPLSLLWMANIKATR